MQESRPPDTGEAKAVSRFLDVWAAAFAGIAADRFMKEGILAAAIPAVVAVAVFALGLWWHQITRGVRPALAASAVAVATDFRWWVAALALLFIYLGSPPLIESWNAGKGSVATPPSPRHEPTVFPPTSAPTAKPEAKSVGDTSVPTALPDLLTPLSGNSLRNMTNEELRTASYTLAGKLGELTDAYYKQSILPERNPNLDTIASRLRLDTEMNKIFRNSYQPSVVEILSELKRRLPKDSGLIELYRSDMDAVTIISLGEIGNLEEVLRRLARDLP